MSPICKDATRPKEEMRGRVKAKLKLCMDLAKGTVNAPLSGESVIAQAFPLPSLFQYTRLVLYLPVTNANPLANANAPMLNWKKRPLRRKTLSLSCFCFLIRCHSCLLASYLIQPFCSTARFSQI